MTPNLRRKAPRDGAPSDGGDLEVASDDAEDAPEAECIDDNDLHREPSAEFEDDAEDAPEAEYTDDEHDGAEHDEAEYIDVDDLPQFPPAQLLRQFPQISAELETIFSPDREADSFLFSGFPSWILLDPVSYIDGDLGCDNATTAEAQTISRREDGVNVSFFTAKPPYPSYFNIHIPSLMEKPYMLCGRPMILYTVRNMALINIIFGGYRRQTEYYLYRVIGPGRRPSLLHLEHVSQELKKVSHVVSVGFLPIDGDGGFTLAAIALEQAKGEQYGLHVFRFERGEWTSKVHVLERHQIGDIRLYNIEKVIPIADRELGFVDLWHGVIVFDLLQASPVPPYIPLPKVLPGNQSKDQLGLSAKCFRDVVFSTEGIKCVEVEMTWKQIVHEKPCTESDVWWESNIIFDSDLMQHETASSEDERVEGTFNYLGWRLICWSRKADLAGWKKDCSICAKDIINKCELWGLNDLNDFYVSFPTLSVDGRQLFMISKENATDLQSCSCVIVIDLGKHVLQAFSQFPTRPDLFTQAFISCDIFKFLNMPPGNPSCCYFPLPLFFSTC